MSENSENIHTFEEPTDLGSGSPRSFRQFFNMLLRFVLIIVGIALIISWSQINDQLYRVLPLAPFIGGKWPNSMAGLPELAPTQTQAPVDWYKNLFTPFPSPPAVELIQPLVLEKAPYVAPRGLFRIEYPQGWIVRPGDQEVNFLSPDGQSRIAIQVTHTGRPLDIQAFRRFVEGRESNGFVHPDTVDKVYIPVEKKVNEDDSSAIVIKELHQENSLELVKSHYRQDGAIIYTIDLWTNEDRFDAYSNSLDEIWEKMSGDMESVDDLQNYQWNFTKKDLGNRFTVNLPIPWLREQNRIRGSRVESYYSPDNHAVIQLITYTTDVELSNSIVGGFALQLLRDFYTNGIVITDDRIAINGNEQLTWYSPKAGYGGKTQFKRIGSNNLIMLSVVIDKQFEEIYQDISARVLNSFHVGGD